MDKIILKIAGFNIIINLNDSRDNSFFKRKLIEDIKKYLKGFIHKEKRTNDFRITIKQEINSEIINSKKGKSFYFKIFEEEKRSVKCSYEISFKQLNFIIRHIILQLLSTHDGFLMHGSGVAINGKAYIFIGPSGAGKSTIMKMLNKKYPALADDSAIIKQEKGQYYFYQTPMIEKESWVNKQGDKYPIGGIFFLNKSKDLKMEKITSKKQIVKKFISQLLINQDQTRKQIGKIMSFINKFDQFWIVSFSKNIEKLLNLFSKDIL